MVTSVSSTTPGKKIGAMDKISQEQLYSPGLYAMHELMAEPQPVYKEEPGFLRFLGRIVLTAAALCGGAVLLRKNVPSMKKDALDLTKELNKDAKFGEKAKYSIAKFADWIEDGFKSLFKKEKNN